MKELPEYKDIINIMKEYAESKDKTQREICANAHKKKRKGDCKVHDINELQVEIDNIKNAPTPDFE